MIGKSEALVEKWGALLREVDEGKAPIVARLMEDECVYLKDVHGTDKSPPAGVLKCVFPTLRLAGEWLNPHEIVLEQVRDVILESFTKVAQRLDEHLEMDHDIGLFLNGMTLRAIATLKSIAAEN